MRRISVKDGKMPEDAESNTMQQWHMVWKLSMNKNCTGARRRERAGRKDLSLDSEEILQTQIPEALRCCEQKIYLQMCKMRGNEAI